MAGFIRLEPRDLDADPTDLTVTLSMPKQYVEKDSIRIPPFSTNSTITEYTIGSVEENGENYTISIYFTVYDRTQTLMLPFTLSFLDDVVPDNYRLPVTASVSGGDAAAPTIYRPLYKDWEIQKFVNSNRLDAFGKDGAEVVVTPQEEGGNPYLDDLTYVDFAFIVNKYTNDQCGLADLRDARSVTLTDTLPTYTDRNGVSRIAVFDADQNPGWTLSEDGKTVSRTYRRTFRRDPAADLQRRAASALPRPAVHRGRRRDADGGVEQLGRTHGHPERRSAGRDAPGGRRPAPLPPDDRPHHTG